MKLWKSIFVFSFLFLSACNNSTETIADLEYEEFRDKVNSEEFTGFAYLLSDWEAEEEGYITVIEDVFDRENETLTFTNIQTADNETYEIMNKDTSNPEVYLPSDRITFVKDGRVLSEFDINSQIFSKENNSELRQFIQNHQ
ncbi:hypothetical protein [Halalkalibacter lacteus]|uniref:hypothetical protein n=1 Tax=Halalkalibacter lacteus TaxID=3090663 RepID=UPI002FCA6BA6